MDGFLDLLRDNSSVLGRLVSTAVLVAAAVPLGAVLGGVAARRGSDPYARYYLRKASRYAVLVAVLLVLAVLWRPFAGRSGVVLGLAAAGVAFAMQEVIGALAGWVSILSSRLFGVGDRGQMGGVHGDVLDITPLRTKLLEIGSLDGRESWVRARQYTGRLVSVSNKAVSDEPVHNSSAAFDYLWEELPLPVPLPGGLAPRRAHPARGGRARVGVFGRPAGHDRDASPLSGQVVRCRAVRVRASYRRLGGAVCSVRGAGERRAPCQEHHDAGGSIGSPKLAFRWRLLRRTDITVHRAEES